MRFAVALRDNRIFDCLIEYFVSAPAEYFFGLVIPAGNVTIEVHLHHGIDRRLEKGFELGVLREDDFFLLAQVGLERFQPFLEQGRFLGLFLKRFCIRHIGCIRLGSGLSIVLILNYGPAQKSPD